MSEEVEPEIVPTVPEIQPLTQSLREINLSLRRDSTDRVETRLDRIFRDLKSQREQRRIKFFQRDALFDLIANGVQICEPLCADFKVVDTQNRVSAIFVKRPEEHFSPMLMVKKRLLTALFGIQVIEDHDE